MTRGLTKVERLILDEVCSRLSSESKSIVGSQVSETTLVQRDRGRAYLYRTKFRFFKRAFSRNFTISVEELPLAGASIRTRVGDQIGVDVWVAGGRVFSLEYPPAFTLPTDEAEVEQVKAHVVFDPEHLGDVREGAGRPEAARSWLSSQGISFGMEEIVSAKAPLLRSVREKWLEHLATVIPESWVDLLSECDGFAGQSFQIHGLVGMPRVPSGQRELLVLAQRHAEPQCLCIEKGSTSQKLMTVDYEGGIHQTYSAEFSTVAQQFLQGDKD